MTYKECCKKVLSTYMFDNLRTIVDYTNLHDEAFSGNVSMQKRYSNFL